MKLRLARQSPVNGRCLGPAGVGVAVFLGLVGVAAGPAGAENRREASEKTFEVRGFSSLEVENARGRIEVVAGAPGRVKVSALKTIRSRSEESAAELSAATLVETEVRSGRLAVRVKYPQRRSIKINLWAGFDSDDVPRSDVRLTIEVPPGFPVALRSSSGDQATQGLRGAQSLTATSGDVTVAQSAGGVEIRTTSGDVAVHGAGGPVRVTTSSGDVEVPSASDSLTIETASGDVEIDEASAGVVIQTASGEVRVLGAARRVRIETVSGEIRAALLSPLLGAWLTTSSGDVVAELDDRIGCRLDMRTSSGSIDLEVPARTHSVSRHAITATIGDGKAPVEVQSASGDITITGRSR